MMPNAARRIECLGCGKAMTAGDRTKVLREIKTR
jgi:ribosomal protein S27E